MFHFFDSVTNTKGDALIGYYVQVVDPNTGNAQTLYADNNLTPIVSVSGVADKAKVDSNGNANFYVATGTYTLNVYATDGTTLVLPIPDWPMNIDEDTAATAVAAQNAAAASATAAAASATAAAQLAAGIVDISAAENAIIAALAAGGSVSLSTLETSGLPYRPEWFGAKGDGTTNDTAAFQAMAALVSSNGGGTISLTPGATYIVGKQTLVNNGAVMFQGQHVLHIHGCTLGVVIRGNGAKLKLAAGLKFGTFNSSGASTTHSLPYSGGDASTVTDPATGGVITIESCTGPVRVENVELDGNMSNLTIGGPFGDTGTQLAGDGLCFSGNTGGVSVEGVNAHHFPRDGGLGWGSGVTGNTPPLEPHVFQNCIFDHNGRQGFSIVGGKGWTFRRSRFSNSGVPGLPVSSAPAAGVDVEAETGSIRNVYFESCVFTNCAGASFVADSGDSADIRFKGCTFDNPSNWAAWLEKPGIVLEDCRSFGPIIFSDPSDTAQAVRFIRHYFSDATTDSYTGSAGNWSSLGVGVSLAFGAGGGAAGSNASFERCEWNAGNGSNPLPAANLTGSIISDVTVNQPVGSASFNACTFRGINKIVAPSLSIAGNFPSIILQGAISLNGAVTSGYTVYGATSSYYVKTRDTGADYQIYNLGGTLRVWNGFDRLQLDGSGNMSLTGNITAVPPASATPASNGQMTFQLTSNTSLAIKVKGSDGTVRSATLTLA